MKKLVLLSAVFGVCAAFAARQPLSRYQSIIDRQMFGQPPPGFDPTKPASEVSGSRAEQRELTQEQEKLQSSVQFSVINITPEGETAVGFTDNSDPKQPKHYYLKVGEERDGWLVKEADPVEASMTIAKGDIEVALKIGENSSKGGSTTKAANASHPDGAQQPPRFQMMNSLRGRRKARLAEQQQQQAALAEKRAAEKAEREEREAAKEAQRQQEREEQRQQLLAIQEELKRAREARTKDNAQESSENAGNDNQ